MTQTTSQMIADPNFRLMHIDSQRKFFYREMRERLVKGDVEGALSSLEELNHMFDFNLRKNGDGQPSPV